MFATEMRNSKWLPKTCKPPTPFDRSLPLCSVLVMGLSKKKKKRKKKLKLRDILYSV